MIDKFYNGVVGTFIFSIALLCVLIKYRDALTPDLLHFTTCMVEEEAHFIWVMFLWLCYKCFLDVDQSSGALMSDAQKQEEKLKVIVKGAIELFISLGLMTADMKHTGPWLYCSVIYAVACLRVIFSAQFSLTFILFLISYQTQNFIVNLIDFIFFQ